MHRIGCAGQTIHGKTPWTIMRPAPPAGIATGWDRLAAPAVRLCRQGVSELLRDVQKQMPRELRHGLTARETPRLRGGGAWLVLKAAAAHGPNAQGHGRPWSHPWLLVEAVCGCRCGMALELPYHEGGLNRQVEVPCRGMSMSAMRRSIQEAASSHPGLTECKAPVHLNSTLPLSGWRTT